MTSGFRTECPECFSVFRLKDESAIGKRMKCRECGKPFQIQPAEDSDFDGDVFGGGQRSAAAPPPTSRGRSTSKKRKKKSKPFPWKPVAGAGALVAVVLAAVMGGYQAVTGFVSTVSTSGLSSVFDSHEALLDESLKNYAELEDALAAVNTEEDIPDALQTLEKIKQRTGGYDARLIALGEIDRERAGELVKYWNAGKDERKAAYDRVKAEVDRLKNTGLMTDDLAWDLTFFRSVNFDFDLVLKLPEPDSSKPRAVYFHNRTVALRRAAAAVSQVRDASTGSEKLDEIRSITAEIKVLAEQASQREYQRVTSDVSSPYFAPHLAAEVTFSRLARTASERAAVSEEVLEAIQTLSTAISQLSFADMGVATAASAKQGQPAGTAAGSQLEGTGRFPRISAGSPPDGEARLTELQALVAAGDNAAPVVILRGTGRGMMPLLPSVSRVFRGQMQGVQSHRSGETEYVVIRLEGSLESLAEQINFGTVAGIDPAVRLISIDLSRRPENTTPVAGGNPVAGTPGTGRPGPGRPGQRPAGSVPGYRPAGGSPAAGVDDRRASFAKQVGGAEKMVTLNLEGITNDRLQAFLNSLREAKLTSAFSLRRGTVYMGWSESPQALAARIDFAEVVSVNDEERTLEVKLPE